MHVLSWIAHKVKSLSIFFQFDIMFTDHMFHKHLYCTHTLPPTTVVMVKVMVTVMILSFNDTYNKSAARPSISCPSVKIESITFWQSCINVNHCGRCILFSMLRGGIKSSFSATFTACRWSSILSGLCVTVCNFINTPGSWAVRRPNQSSSLWQWWYATWTAAMRERSSEWVDEWEDRSGPLIIVSSAFSINCEEDRERI